MMIFLLFWGLVTVVGLFTHFPESVANRSLNWASAPHIFAYERRHVCKYCCSASCTPQPSPLESLWDEVSVILVCQRCAAQTVSRFTGVVTRPSGPVFDTPTAGKLSSPGGSAQTALFLMWFGLLLCQHRRAV